MIERRTFFNTASAGRLYSSWTRTNQSGDAELFTSLRTLRARARDLGRNDGYLKRFYRLTGTNVVGPNGIVMKSTAGRNGRDTGAQEKIETAWKTWGRRGNCDVTGRYSWTSLQQQVVRSVATDGEILIRKITGPAAGEFGFALQLIEADHLDEMYNDVLPNGNRIKMGIEYNAFNRPVAYHIYEEHPGESQFATYQSKERMRVPAKEMIHLFVPNRPSMGRGLPWAYAVGGRSNMLDGYEEAELVGARVAAAKGGFYTTENGEEYTGDKQDEDGNPVQELEPGTFELLPHGIGFTQYDPQHPGQNFSFFTKTILRGIAAGLDVGYSTLTTDLTEVNYSSIRAGLLDERDVWRELQTWLIDHLLIDVFENWLKMAMLTEMVQLPFSRFELFCKCKFQPRGWKWVDPQKDINAATIAMSQGLTSATQIAAEQGRDVREIYQDLASEARLREEMGLSLPEVQININVDSANQE